ncbi:MAG: 2-C-methyl-D-erythritol 4-phosphate cytidylyltransferase [Tissierellia bacterium]|nr:2-C-methyl-D-erythritol 4-phosphate cytidylyltransferase [Tissierellia bacterium]
MYQNNFVSVIVAAAGMSNRMGSKINKQFLKIDHKPILAHTLEKFDECKYIDEIIVVAKTEEVDYVRREIINRYAIRKAHRIVKGGKERQDSILNGLMRVDPRANIVLTHDGARPFIKVKTIEKAIESLETMGDLIVAVPEKDTIKVVNDDNSVHHTPKRSTLWKAQTPQVFFADHLREAYRKASEECYYGTDDAFLVEMAGYPVKVIMGQYDNIKITTPEDLVIAETLSRDRESIYDMVGL